MASYQSDTTVSGATDAAVLATLGARLQRHRLERNLTQAQLAREAGLSKRTLARLEAGESTQLTNLVRVIRALGLVDRLVALVPEPLPSPVEQLKVHGKRRRRASGRSKDLARDEPWSWERTENEHDGPTGDAIGDAIGGAGV